MRKLIDWYACFNEIWVSYQPRFVSKVLAFMAHKGELSLYGVTITGGDLV
ncbi:MAG: hypothetical protein HND59_03475 [Pseudomonadota bacterium]|nr:MAG: hypothetical protein HND59_03475 [Pseudomonadota bacterium]